MDWRSLLFLPIFFSAVPALHICSGDVVRSCAPQHILLTKISATNHIAKQLLLECNAHQNCTMTLDDEECVEYEYYCLPDIQNKMEITEASVAQLQTTNLVNAMSEKYQEGHEMDAKDIQCELDFQDRSVKTIGFTVFDFAPFIHSDDLCLQINNTEKKPFCSGSHKLNEPYGPFKSSTGFQFSITRSGDPANSAKVRFWFLIDVSPNHVTFQLKCSSKEVFETTTDGAAEEASDTPTATTGSTSATHIIAVVLPILLTIALAIAIGVGLYWRTKRVQKRRLSAHIQLQSYLRAKDSPNIKTGDRDEVDTSSLNVAGNMTSIEMTGIKIKSCQHIPGFSLDRKLQSSPRINVIENMTSTEIIGPISKSCQHIPGFSIQDRKLPSPPRVNAAKNIISIEMIGPISKSCHHIPGFSSQDRKLPSPSRVNVAENMTSIEIIGPISKSCHLIPGFGRQDRKLPSPPSLMDNTAGRHPLLIPDTNVEMLDRVPGKDTITVDECVPPSINQEENPLDNQDSSFNTEMTHGVKSAEGVEESQILTEDQESLIPPEERYKPTIVVQLPCILSINQEENPTEDQDSSFNTEMTHLVNSIEAMEESLTDESDEDNVYINVGQASLIPYEPLPGTSRINQEENPTEDQDSSFNAEMTHRVSSMEGVEESQNLTDESAEDNVYFHFEPESLIPLEERYKPTIYEPLPGTSGIHQEANPIEDQDGSMNHRVKSTKEVEESQNLTDESDEDDDYIHLDQASLIPPEERNKPTIYEPLPGRSCLNQEVNPIEDQDSSFNAEMTYGVRSTNGAEENQNLSDETAEDNVYIHFDQESPILPEERCKPTIYEPLPDLLREENAVEIIKEPSEIAGNAEDKREDESVTNDNASSSDEDEPYYLELIDDDADS